MQVMKLKDVAASIKARENSQPLDAEQKFISCILNDPQHLPEIFRFLDPHDFDDNEFAWIYYSFQKTYSGLTMGTPVWLKKMLDYFSAEMEVDTDIVYLDEALAKASKEARIKARMRELADSAVAGAHPVTLARAVRKESLRRKMVAAAEEWARFDVFRLTNVP